MVSSVPITCRHLKPTKDNSHSAKLMRKESEDDIAQICAQRAARCSALDKSMACDEYTITSRPP